MKEIYEVTSGILNKFGRATGIDTVTNKLADIIAVVLENPEDHALIIVISIAVLLILLSLAVAKTEWDSIPRFTKHRRNFLSYFLSGEWFGGL